MTAIEAILGGIAALLALTLGLTLVRNGRKTPTEDEVERILDAFRTLKQEWVDTVDRLTRWERRWNKRARDEAPEIPAADVLHFKSSRMRLRALERSRRKAESGDGANETQR